jgi:outer membrane immunogenic protein
MKRFLLTTAAFGMLALPAMAADMAPAPVYKAPIAVPVLCTWCGLYVGANVDGAWTNTTVTTSASSTFNNGFPGSVEAAPVEAALANTSIGAGNKAHFIGGGQIGYNWQWSSIVAGIETDFQGIASSSNTSTVTSLGSTFFNGPLRQTATASSQVDDLGTLRARLGFLVTPALLAYATGGLAYGEAKASASNSQVFFADPLVSGSLPHTGAGSFSQTRVGSTVGGGLEWRFAPNWSVKGEYLYYNLGTGSFSYINNHFLTGGGLFTTTALTSAVKLDGQIARVGVNYKFW